MTARRLRMPPAPQPAPPIAAGLRAPGVVASAWNPYRAIGQGPRSRRAAPKATLEQWRVTQQLRAMTPEKRRASLLARISHAIAPSRKK